VLSSVSLLCFAGCGSGSNEDGSAATSLAKSAKADFCTVAKGITKADLSLKQGDVDSVKLYYANQVGMSTSLAFAAPDEIKLVAKNLQNGTIELFKLLESFKFSFTKMSSTPSAVAKIKEISEKYQLDESDSKMNKYLLDKCGISIQQQGVPTTVS